MNYRKQESLVPPDLLQVLAQRHLQVFKPNKV